MNRLLVSLLAALTLLGGYTAYVVTPKEPSWNEARTYRGTQYSLTTSNRVLCIIRTEDNQPLFADFALVTQTSLVEFAAVNEPLKEINPWFERECVPHLNHLPSHLAQPLRRQLGILS